MKQAYVAIRMKMDDFLKGQNPTTQPGVQMPYYPREHQAMDAAVRQSQKLEQVPGMRAYFVATVNVDEVIYGKLDTLNPNDVQKLTMAVCKPGETPNQTNTLHIFRNDLSLQQMADMARTVLTRMQQGATMREANKQAYYTQHPGHVHAHREFTEGYGIDSSAPGSAGSAGLGDAMPGASVNAAGNGLAAAVSEHHTPGASGDTSPVINAYAAQQFEFLPDALYQQAMNAFNAKMASYTQTSGITADLVGREAAAVTYTMQVIADDVTRQHPDIAMQAYNTMCAAQKLATEHGMDWSDMEHKPEADHAKYLADHCQGMSSTCVAAITAKYHEYFRESNAYTLPEQQALALHAAVSDMAEHRLRHVVTGDLRGNDSKLLLALRDNMSQELADREIRPGALLDDNRDEQDVGDDAI